MDNITLTKLIASPISKMTWSQIQRVSQLRPAVRNDFESSILNSEIGTSFLKSSTVTSLPSAQKQLSKRLPKVCVNGFSTSTNHNFLNKLSTYDRHQFEAPPAPLYTHKTEVEPVLVEGVGWAGQPIVRRTHPILPEAYGDLSDIFTAVEKPPVSVKVNEQTLLSSQTCGANKIISDNAQMQALNLEVKEVSKKNPDPVKNDLVSTNKTKENTEVKSRSRSTDAISFIEENIQNDPTKHLEPKETYFIPSRAGTVKSNGGIKRNPGGQAISKVGFMTKKEDKRLKKLKNAHLNSGLVLTKQKRKSKKKYKLSHSKAYIPLKLKTKIKASNRNTSSTPLFGGNQKMPAQPNIFLAQRMSARPVRKSCIVLANRQIQTHARANQAKVSLNVKEKTSTTIIALSKKQNKSSKIIPASKYPEDCKCPKVLETKTRFPTQICGEAAETEKKKKKLKERKGKMCPIEKELKHKTKTVVCESAKFGKAKKKRQLPKCVKPEKPIAPRVLICPPILEEELKKGEKKKCVKVEEVKIRTRTKVCKPVIIYQKEVAAVVVQKAACVEKVKKTISRHTKICSKPEKNGKQEKSKK